MMMIGTPTTMTNGSHALGSMLSPGQPLVHSDLMTIQRGRYSPLCTREETEA